jgi:hypothetical protein
MNANEMKTEATKTPAERFQAARAAVMQAETAGMSKSTLAKRWKAYFAAEDALKSTAGVWA